MRSEDSLRALLRRLDGRGYKAYSELRGACFALGDLELYVDHVQGDPFASPSRIRIRQRYAAAGLPQRLSATAFARVAFRDWVARRMQGVLSEYRGDGDGSGGSGRISIDAGGQEVLDRSALRLDGETLELRLEVGLPAAGRKILGRPAETLLADRLREAASRALQIDDCACREAMSFVACVENQESIRAELEKRGLVAFVAEDSLLPRRSGIDDRPLGNGIPFHGPASLRVEFVLPHPPRRVVGMGIRRGVTLIVGGGYHGKSTLLRALERGVYPHVPGDGREGVVTDRRAVKIRAEDGRRVAGVAIESFIRDLPFFDEDRDNRNDRNRQRGQTTSAFNSEDASGSTSQAANVMEALEVGAKLLLMDEDSCATNFMTRDARMQALVPPEREPITPLVDRVRELFDEHGVSTVLVAGSSGDFFAHADSVLEMKRFKAVDRGVDARALGALDDARRVGEARAPFKPPRARVPMLESLHPNTVDEGEPRGRGGGRAGRVSARGREKIRYGKQDIDLRGLEQLVDPSQTRAIGRGLVWIAQHGDPSACLSEHLDALEETLDGAGLDALSPSEPDKHPGDLARPRRFEVAGALNRLRALRIRP